MSNCALAQVSASNTTTPRSFVGLWAPRFSGSVVGSGDPSASGLCVGWVPCSVVAGGAGLWSPLPLPVSDSGPAPQEHAAPASITLKKPGPVTAQTRISCSFTETADPPAELPAHCHRGSHLRACRPPLLDCAGLEAKEERDRREENVFMPPYSRRSIAVLINYRMWFPVGVCLGTPGDFALGGVPTLAPDQNVASSPLPKEN